MNEVWAKRFEKYVETKSKEIFAFIGLHHWTANTKMVLFMLAFFAPVCFIVIGSIIAGVIYCYNTTCELLYDRKLKRLEAYEKDLL